MYGRELYKQILSSLIVIVFLITLVLGRTNQQLAITQVTPSLPPAVSPAPTISSQPVPEEYFQPITPSGQLQLVYYNTYDYTTRVPEPITKTALVYLPPGYDPSGQTRYNIIYWLHGWEMTNNEFLRLGDDGTVHLLDHLIINGEMAPVIVVSLTFDRDNQPQDWSRSVAEMSLFDREVRHDLLPQIESLYPTYATATDEASLVASREHRAFSGFSLGAVATWYEFERNLDLFSYFVPISGDSWTIQESGGAAATAATVDKLARVASTAGYDFRIIQANGTKDIYYEPINTQMEAMIARPEVFNASNLTYFIKSDGEHDMFAIWEAVYNAFPRLFRVN